MCLEIIYLIYMNKKDLALNKLQGLRYHKTKASQTKSLLKKTYFWSNVESQGGMFRKLWNSHLRSENSIISDVIWEEKYLQEIFLHTSRKFCTS